MNENWDILDRVGGAQLPLMATIDLDYKLSGDAAIGWALAGSTLSGNTYTSLWAAMKVAYDRSTAANETHYNKTYSVKIDADTGWRFVTADVYYKALSALGDSLGHVLDTNAKLFTLGVVGILMIYLHMILDIWAVYGMKPCLMSRVNSMFPM